MQRAVILLWASCLYMLVRLILYLIWMASPLRRVLTLAVLALALICRRSPEETRKNH